MKAAQINGYGGKAVMAVTDNAPRPPIEANQVLIEVHAAGVNPFDWKVREGYMQQMLPLTFPATLGGDLAGIVSELGSSVDGFTVGDEVYGAAGALSGVGSFAEYAPVSSGQLYAKPKTTNFTTAAALPLAGCSAYQALAEHINLQAGQKILIHGGAGGIGSLAIQLAKHLGAYVATTVSGGDADFVKQLGADEVIDYKTEDFAELIQDYDAVFDTVGGEITEKSYGVLKPGGTLVSMVGSADESKAKSHNITAVNQASKATTERLQKLAELVDEGFMTVNVDKVFSLDEAPEALEHLKTSKTRGKVVISVK